MLSGRIVNIKDTILFRGTTVPEAIQSFKEAVDDYLAYCQERGIPAERPFSGNIPFRTSPEVHRNIFLAARFARKSTNAWMNDILSAAADAAVAASRQRVVGVSV